MSVTGKSRMKAERTVVSTHRLVTTPQIISRETARPRSSDRTQRMPSVSRPWQLILGRDDMPDDFAYLLARAYDENRQLFRQTHIPYSYDSHEVARDNGIPLHPGAARYYREHGYLN